MAQFEDGTAVEAEGWAEGLAMSADEETSQHSIVHSCIVLFLGQCHCVNVMLLCS